MTNFIPIFPLSIVVFPNERLNLHIFEPRYKQLILECIKTKKAFGIPVVMGNTILEFGTLVEVAALKQQYENGNMDISILGLRVFSILEVTKEIPEKLYSGAIVHYPANETALIRAQVAMVAKAVRLLHQKLQVEKPFPKPDDALSSYDIAHLAGLSMQEEYELLQLLHESQRLEYLKRHLQKVVPVVEEMEALKQKIKLNGHFRELEGFGFE